MHDLLVVFETTRGLWVRRSTFERSFAVPQSPRTFVRRSVCERSDIPVDLPDVLPNTGNAIHSRGSARTIVRPASP